MPIITTSMEDYAQRQSLAGLAAQIWSAGGLVVIPTETVYGASVLATHDRGWETLTALRPDMVLEGLTIHLHDPQAARCYMPTNQPMWQRLIEKFWPGPVTIKIEISEDRLLQQLNMLGTQVRILRRIFAQGAISLRCPDHPMARQMLEAAPGPIVAIPAGLPGQEPVVDASVAHRLIGTRADLVIDGGPSRYAKVSTVIRLRQREGWPVVMVEQEGVYDARIIRRMACMTILFVCTGNTCRSPMAEAMARDALAKMRHLSVDELEAAGLRVMSAGVYAADGSPASSQAIAAMAGLGLDLSSHRSRLLTPQIVRDADRVYCMTEHHVRAVTAMCPALADRVMCLDAQGDIMDPIGASVNEYARCAGQIRSAMMARFKEFFP